MSPICNINADKLTMVWLNVTKVGTEIGVEIVVTTTDEHPAKVKLHNFAHICEPYHLEVVKVPKMEHKLTDVVLNPANIEKRNVKLANVCFHESTINQCFKLFQ